MKFLKALPLYLLLFKHKMLGKTRKYYGKPFKVMFDFNSSE